MLTPRERELLSDLDRRFGTSGECRSLSAGTLNIKVAVTKNAKPEKLSNPINCFAGSRKPLSEMKITTRAGRACTESSTKRHVWRKNGYNKLRQQRVDCTVCGAHGVAR